MNYEYKRITIFGGTLDEEATALLNKYAAEGWELISVACEGYMQRVYLRREKSNSNHL